MRLFQHYGKIETNVVDQYKSLEGIQHVFTRSDGIRVSKDSDTHYFFYKKRIVETVTHVNDTSWKFMDTVKKVKNALSCHIVSSDTNIAIFDEDETVFDDDDRGIDLLDFHLGSGEKRPDEVYNHIYEPELSTRLIVYFKKVDGINCIIHVCELGTSRIVCSKSDPFSKCRMDLRKCLDVAIRCHSVLKRFATES